MPIYGGSRRINSKVIFAADRFWCDSYMDYKFITRKLVPFISLETQIIH